MLMSCYFPAKLISLIRLVENRYFPLPQYQSRPIDPTIAGETKHLVGMVFLEIHMTVNFTLILASLGSVFDSSGLVHGTGERVVISAPNMMES